MFGGFCQSFCNTSLVTEEIQRSTPAVWITLFVSALWTKLNHGKLVMKQFRLKLIRRTNKKTFLCVSAIKNPGISVHSVLSNSITLMIYPLTFNCALSQTKHLWIYRHITHFLDVQKSNLTFAQHYFYLKAFAQSMIK